VLGESKSYVLRGFDLEMAGAVGSAANQLQMIVAEGSVMHGNSTESGTYFVVPSGTSNEIINSTTNDRVDGSFTPGTLNYVGLEFTREIDDSTTGQVFFWNPTTSSEISKTIPLAQTFDFKVVVTSSIWASNVLPISVVETDASNNVVSVQDRRPMLFRLGTGGTATPDPFYQYPWTDHAEGRAENFWESNSTTSPFRGGDKQIATLKDWMDAMMTSILEIKGTAYWYTNTTPGSLTKLRLDVANTQMTGTGVFTHSALTPGQMNWDSDLFLNNISSRLEYKILTNAATTDISLSDNQVAYVKLVRNVLITPQLIFTNGSATVSSVGSVAWTSDVQADDFVKIADENETKYYKILSVDTASQVTLTETFPDPSETNYAHYAWGTYQTDASPSTNRHVYASNRYNVPFDADTYWLFLRADNGGAQARVYLRGAAGGEIEQGESREISDNTTNEVLEYVGSPSEVDTTPDYTNSIVTGVAEITRVFLAAEPAFGPSDKILLNSANDYRKYYVWYNVDGITPDPKIPGLIGIEVSISSGDPATVVAAATQLVLDAMGDFNVTDNLSGTIDVENSQVGATTNIGGSFSTIVLTPGAGDFNHYVMDDENLTQAIKRLDNKVGDLDKVIEEQGYEEELEIISVPPSNDHELAGPLSTLAFISLPFNSRDNDIQQTYTVGSGELNIYLNGMLINVGRDYIEIGAPGADGYTIQTLIPIPVGYVFTFEIVSNASLSNSGSDTTASNLGPASNANVFKQLAGDDLQFRRLTAGSGINIVEGVNDISFSAVASVAASTVNTITGTNYTILSSDDIMLAANGGIDITLTLPSATSSGKILNIKKIDAGNTLYIKSVSAQTLDGVNIEASPQAVTIQNESLTIVADGSNWWLI